MKKIGMVVVIIGIISLVIGIISRLTVTPIAGLESRAFAGFTALCFLLAIALTNLQKQ